jgi:RNA polymerase sigma factor (sigma-70 family)
MRRTTPNPPPPGDRDDAERALLTLSPLDRQILMLSAGEGLHNAEIAARLGISERCAERLLARALRKFDRALEKGTRTKPWWRIP